MPEAIAGAVKQGQPGRMRDAERQSQLRRTHQSGGALQLSGLAAAGGRLRDRRHDGLRSGASNRWAAIAEGNPVYLRDIWPTTREIAAGGRQLDRFGDVPQRVRPGVRRRRALARAQGSRGRSVPLGEGFALRQGAAVLRRSRAQRPRRSTTSRMRACSRCSATASPPITSRRPDRSRPTVRRASI